MRIRAIKPGFFKNEHLCELPFQHRIAFQGLWCSADRDGRLEDRPKRLKADIFPYDDVDMDAVLWSLAKAGFIVRYRVQEAHYIAIPTWQKHQHPRQDEAASAIPDVSAGCVRVSADTAPVTLADTDPSLSSHGPVTAQRMGNGRWEVGNGILEVGGGTPPTPLKPRPRTFGRIDLHRWQLDSLVAWLGPHAATFDLDAWVLDLSKHADREGLVLTKQTLWPWVQAQFRDECQRRGLPLAVASEQPAFGKQSSRLLAAVANLEA